MDVEVKNIEVFDYEESLSKALHPILKGEPIVAVIRDKKLYGTIDDRHTNPNIKDASSIKVGSMAVKPPRIKEDEEFLSILNKFSIEHFKALPVVDAEARPKGYISRAEVISYLLENDMVPKVGLEAVLETPPYTIDADETLGKAKRLMKELRVHRIIVTDKGRLAGVFSTFDFSMFAEKPKERQSKQLIKEVKRIYELRVKDFLREPRVLVPQNADLREALSLMGEKGVSYAIVVDEKEKPLGIITARRIFSLTLRTLTEEPQVVISHIPEDEAWAYDEIKDLLSSEIEKISKMFKVGHAHVNVKEGKSVYKVDVTLEIEDRPYHFHGEHYELTMAVRELADNIDRVVKKLKDKLKHRKVDLVEEIE